MEFRLLGDVEARDEGGRVVALGARQRAVLAVLLYRANAVVPRAELVRLVWGPQPQDWPVTVEQLVTDYVSHLRGLLGRAGGGVRLLARAPGFVAELDARLVDWHRFAGLCRQAGAAREAGERAEAVRLLRAALGLWRGPALADLAGGLDPVRARMDERRLAAAEDLAELELDRGAAGVVVELLGELSAAHPERERLAALLVRALHAAGRRDEAAAVYQRTRRHLAEDLGLDPAEVLERAYQAVLTGTAPAGAARPQVVPAQLPADVSGFAGRAEHLARLDALLAGGAAEAPTAVVISAVSGTAGVGKTALAVRWAHRVADRFPDGQLYVNLRGFDPGGQVMAPAAAVRGFLDAFEVPAERVPASLEAQLALFRSLLAGRRVLVVLDNARDAEQARPLLPGTSTALVVVTSRSQLTSLVAVDGAHPLTLDLLTADEARELLARRLGRERVAAEPAAVEQVIGCCARLPLALTIAAARAAQSGFPLTALACELVEASRRLDALDAGDAVSQVRAVFSWSYTALSPAAAGLFRLLGLHPGPDISAAAAGSLAAVPPAETRRLLAELARASLLTEHVPGRYGFHDLLRAYAADLTHTVDPGDQRRAGIGRVLDHYLHTAHTADRLLHPHRDPIPLALPPPGPGVTPEQPADYGQALDWLAAEHPVLLAAVGLAADAGLDTHCWQLAWALATFLDRRGHWHDLTTTWQAALTAAGRLHDPAAQADAHRLLASAHTRLGRYPDAHTHHTHALHLYTRTGDHTGQAGTHNNLAILWELQGRPE